MHIKSVFASEVMEEEIYIEQPWGFVVNGEETNVWMLDKSLYGLK